MSFSLFNGMNILQDSTITKIGRIDTFATKRGTNFIFNPPSGYNLKHFHSTFSVTLPVLSSPLAIDHSPNL